MNSKQNILSLFVCSFLTIKHSLLRINHMLHYKRNWIHLDVQIRELYFSIWKYTYSKFQDVSLLHRSNTNSKFLDYPKKPVYTSKIFDHFLNKPSFLIIILSWTPPWPSYHKILYSIVSSTFIRSSLFKWFIFLV